MSEQISGQTAQLTFFAPTTPPPSKLYEAALSDAEFEESFWPAWRSRLHRPNNPKQPALASYRRARRTASLADILAGVARTIPSPDPTMRPMASTWLNQHRWEDDAGPDLAADPWGLGAFTDGLTDTEGISARSYEPEALYAVLAATGWPVTWRGDLSLLNAWLAVGHTPEGIATIICGAVAGHGQRASLKAFDGIVRARAMRIDL